MSKTIGSFVIRDEGDGCLTSKFLANADNTPHTEACKIQTPRLPNDPFVGTFRTTWVEPTRTDKAMLEIKREGDIYILEWKEKSQSFWNGKAMLFEGKLVGSYWKSENNS